MIKRALIYGKDIPHTVDCSIAFHGFEELEFEITLSKNWLALNTNDFLKYDICVGGVNDCRFVLYKLGVKNYDITCYPSELAFFLNRNVSVSEIKNICNIQENKFVKPVKPKRFSAFKTKDKDALFNVMSLDEEEKIFVSDIVQFKTEWRVYVFNNEIKAVCNYNGDPTLFPDISVVKSMIASFKGPCCYVLDVGVVGKKTSLVEFNDFYSIGNYGLQPIDYAEMLFARWKQLTNGCLKKGF